MGDSPRKRGTSVDTSKNIKNTDSLNGLNLLVHAASVYSQLLVSKRNDPSILGLIPELERTFSMMHPLAENIQFEAVLSIIRSAESLITMIKKCSLEKLEKQGRYRRAMSALWDAMSTIGHILKKADHDFSMEVGIVLHRLEKSQRELEALTQAA